MCFPLEKHRLNWQYALRITKPKKPTRRVEPTTVVPGIYTQEHLTEYCHRIAALSIRNFGSLGAFLLKHAVNHYFPRKLLSSFRFFAELADAYVQFRNSFLKGRMVLQPDGRFLSARALTA